MLEVHYGSFIHKMKVILWGEKIYDGKFPSGREVQEGKLNQLSREKVVFKLLSMNLLTGRENWKLRDRWIDDELRSWWNWWCHIGVRGRFKRLESHRNIKGMYLLYSVTQFWNLSFTYSSLVTGTNKITPCKSTFIFVVQRFV